jgi:hypothetical protein
MIGLFSNVTKSFKVATNLKKINIDNAAFKVHYRLTTTILVIITAIVCGQQFIGGPIDCMQSSSAIDTKVLNTYCYFIGKSLSLVRNILCEFLR